MDRTGTMGRDARKFKLSVLVFLAQAAICWGTMLEVRHIHYAYSNLLFPLLLGLGASFAEALRPLLGDSSRPTALVMAVLYVSLVALLCVLLSCSQRQMIRLVGYIVAAALVLLNVLWFSTAALNNCC